MDHLDGCACWVAGSLELRGLAGCISLGGFIQIKAIDFSLSKVGLSLRFPVVSGRYRYRSSSSTSIF